MRLQGSSCSCAWRVAAGSALLANQASIRGTRISPGEIELTRMPCAAYSSTIAVACSMVASLSAPKVTSYLHRTSKDLPPSIGVLVGSDEAGAAVAKDVAQHIAAMSPTFLSREDVPAETVVN